MKNKDLDIALVPIARETFDMVLAKEKTDTVRKAFEKAGFTVSGPSSMITDMEEAASSSSRLARQPVDLLVLLQASFADSTMAMHFADRMDAPLLLWALPEERTGGRLRLNSFCGINLTAHALRRANQRYDYVYASPGDADALEKVRVLAAAGKACRLLRRARIGRVGENPAGFDSCLFNGEALKSRFGVEVAQIELEDLFQRSRQVDPARVESLFRELQEKLERIDELDPNAVRRTMASYFALHQLAEEQHLDGMAVRCWPQFFTELKCAACGAMSLLTEDRIPCSCEADVNGTITQLLLQTLTGGAAFGTDLVSFETDKNLAVIWHCGLAPLSMADPAIKPRGAVHSNRLLPLLMEFPLKPGRVTLARLSEAGGNYRLVVGNGEMLRAPLSFSGTAGVVRFDRPASEVMDKIIMEGLEHHMAVTYGDIVPELLALAKILDLPVLRL